MTTDVTTPEPDGATPSTESSIWIRGLYMILFAVIAYIAELVIGLVMVIQFVLKASTDKTNNNLLSFGNQLGKYILEIIQFLTFNTEVKPFPFNDWPQADESVDVERDEEVGDN